MKNSKKIDMVIKDLQSIKRTVKVTEGYEQGCKETKQKMIKDEIKFLEMFLKRNKATLEPTYGERMGILSKEDREYNKALTQICKVQNIVIQKRLKELKSQVEKT